MLVTDSGQSVLRLLAASFVCKIHREISYRCWCQTAAVMYALFHCCLQGGMADAMFIVLFLFMTVGRYPRLSIVTWLLCVAPMHTLSSLPTEHSNRHAVCQLYTLSVSHYFAFPKFGLYARSARSCTAHAGICRGTTLEPAAYCYFVSIAMQRLYIRKCHPKCAVTF